MDIIDDEKLRADRRLDGGGHGTRVSGQVPGIDGPAHCQVGALTQHFEPPAGEGSAAGPLCSRPDQRGLTDAALSDQENRLVFFDQIRDPVQLVIAAKERRHGRAKRSCPSARPIR